MSLDKLAIIFIIIILPISLVLNTYTKAQIETLNTQIIYDNRLTNATYDAIKAFQLNTFNESTSDLSNSKIRQIEASVNTFFNSVASNFNMKGYNNNTLQDYVPALVYTMYDGYYIYSKYTNEISEDDAGTTYKDGDQLYGLKPYIYYSCKYNYGNDEFVITYSLDNYITIQGLIDNEWINRSGYLIDTTQTSIDEANKKIVYRKQTITGEDILKEKVGTNTYKYHKINGVKYYYDEYEGANKGKWFSLINGKRYYTNDVFDTDKDYSAYYYYLDAYNFTKFVQTKLRDLTSNNAIIEGDANYDYVKNFVKSNDKIFNTNGIEEPNSSFNEHRLAVIRYSIEKNLPIAIANYNDYSGVTTNFQMPKLKENEWDKILNNISIISFLQGLPMGSKLYNGYSIVTNNKNEEVVTEESIYIADNSTYYKTTKQGLDLDNPIGIFNMDLQRRSIESETEVQKDYYFPKEYFADYESVVTSTKNASLYVSKEDENKNEYKFAYNGNLYKYLDENANPKIAQAYYTALGRERYGMYKTNNIDDSSLFDKYK